MTSIEWKGDQFLERHRVALESTMNQLGDRIVVELHESVNTPYPPSSEEGTPPHRRTGLLATGIRQNTEASEGGVTTDIISDRIGGLVPVYLEFGTSKMAERPYMTPMMIEWTGRILDVVHELYGAHFSG